MLKRNVILIVASVGILAAASFVFLLFAPGNPGTDTRTQNPNPRGSTSEKPTKTVLSEVTPVLDQTPASSMPSPLSDVEEALANIHTTNAPYVADVIAVMDDRVQKYISLLRSETVADSLRRNYMSSEDVLVQSMLPFEEVSDWTTNRDMKLILRGRRVRKLYDEVKAAVLSGDADAVLDGIDQQVDFDLNSFASTKREHERALRAGENFAEVEDRYVSPQAVFPLHLPDGVLPRTLSATSRSLEVSSYLLGEIPRLRSVNTLLKIADFTRPENIESETKATENGHSYKQATWRSGVKAANLYSVADALDKVLTSEEIASSLGSEQTRLVDEYRLWRTGQDWPDREYVTSYAYSSTRTSYDPAGTLFDTDTASATQGRLQLPLPIPSEHVSTYRRSGQLVRDEKQGFAPTDLDAIYQFARRIVSSED